MGEKHLRLTYRFVEEDNNNDVHTQQIFPNVFRQYALSDLSLQELVGSEGLEKNYNFTTYKVGHIYLFNFNFRCPCL